MSSHSVDTLSSMTNANNSASSSSSSMKPTSLAEQRDNASNFITRSRAFGKLCDYVYDICDSTQTGSINQTELYAGVLLVHLNLAKYAGPAACYPAPRKAVNQLFVASDDDKSGGIDKTEFQNIMVITAASISSRIITYYAILIVLVPYLAARIIAVLKFARLDDGVVFIDTVFNNNAPQLLRYIFDIVPNSFWLGLPEQVISLGFFFFVIPKIFDKIDQKGYEAAERTVITPKKAE